MEISLTDREVEMVLKACGEYIWVFGEAEDTTEYTNYMVDTGLGSAIRKIGKGRRISSIYSKYKTVRKYPEFEEWKAQKDDQENEEN